MKTAHIKALATSFDDKEYTLKCVMTAEVTDRHGEIVDVDTMSTENFVINPVVQPFHEYDEPSVGRVTELAKTVLEDGVTKAMECTIKFAVEEYDYAKTLWNLYKGGFMSAFSIGFRVGAVKTDVDTGVTRLMDCELLEISCVAIPANQLALAKSKGLDVSKFMEKVSDKAKRDLLIELKDSLGINDEPKEKQVEPVVVIDKNVAPAIIEKKQDKQLYAKKLLEKAIRALK